MIFAFSNGTVKKKETKNVKTNYWQDNFLPLKNNLDVRVNDTEIM